MEEMTCDLCGEQIKTDRWGGYIEDAGEFWDEAKGENILAHAQCGIDADLPIA